MNKKDMVAKIIREWKNEAQVNDIVVFSAFPCRIKTIKIYTDNPSLMIGCQDNLYRKYKERLKNNCPLLEEIEFVMEV